MNHRIPSSFAAALSTFALAAVVVAGCGQAFSLTGGTGGSGGEGAVTSGVTSAATTSGSGATTGSSAVSSAASTGTGAMGCTWSPAGGNPCSPGQYCDDASCGKTPGSGTCKLKSVPKAGDTPACGCDGLTYWNQSFAAARGIPVQHNVACPADVATTCNAVNACPAVNGVYCRKADKGCLSAVPQGTCWVLPNSCDVTVSMVETCPAKDCVRECDLIKMGISFDQKCN